MSGRAYAAVLVALVVVFVLGLLGANPYVSAACGVWALLMAALVLDVRRRPE